MYVAIKYKNQSGAREMAQGLRTLTPLPHGGSQLSATPVTENPANIHAGKTPMHIK